MPGLDCAVRRFLLSAVFFMYTIACFSCFSGKKTTAIDPSSDDEIMEAPAPDPRLLQMREQAAQIAANLDDRQLCAQVLICGIDGRGRITRDMQILLDECPAGGVMLFRYNLNSSTEDIQNLISEISAYIGERANNIFPFVAVDHEGEPINRFQRGVAALPMPGSYAEIADNDGWDSAFARIEEDSFRAGTEIFNIGINMNLAPVIEFSNAHNSEFLEGRAYGTDPEYVAKAASAFIRGMESAGLLCVAKHFPGSAGKDPHLYKSVINDSIEDLNFLISPFAVLSGGSQLRAVMIAHTLVPARDPARIASLSPGIMKSWLRDELGFPGIILCDDFSMAAAISGGAAARITAVVSSLEAGADMVMVWPSDIRRTLAAIQNALDGGTLPRERLLEAAERIIFEKIRMELAYGEQHGE